MKVALAQINPIIGDLDYNCKKIIHFIGEARGQGAHIVVFPEMAICGYPPEDLLCLGHFVESAEKALRGLAGASEGLSLVVGGVRKNAKGGGKPLFNTAAIFENGKLLGFQDKMLLPDYDVFSERRYFEPGGGQNIWVLQGKKVGVTICEDMWQGYENAYARDPLEELQGKHPEVVINISASPFYVGRERVRLQVCAGAAAKVKAPFLFCNQLGGNDGLIFDGNSLWVSPRGELLGQAPSFTEHLLLCDLENPPAALVMQHRSERDLFSALTLGIRDYFGKLGFTKCCLGLSGGIDSAVVACLAKEALGAENVLAVFMPSRFTSDQSRHDAKKLADTLGIAFQELSIEGPFTSFLNLLEPAFGNRPFDITEENLQSRLRGIILMAFSNKLGHLVLNTGNKSELALGYTTLYGDMCGALAPLGDVTKENVYALARWINRTTEIIPTPILERPPTAELRENQKDSDTMPPYPLLDLVLSAYVEEHLSAAHISEKHSLPLSLVQDLIQRIHAQEYKRRQSPPVLRVTKKAFTTGRRFPIVQRFREAI